MSKPALKAGDKVRIKPSQVTHQHDGKLCLVHVALASGVCVLVTEDGHAFLWREEWCDKL